MIKEIKCLMPIPYATTSNRYFEKYKLDEDVEFTNRWYIDENNDLLVEVYYKDYEQDYLYLSLFGKKVPYWGFYKVVKKKKFINQKNFKYMYVQLINECGK